MNKMITFIYFALIVIPTLNGVNAFPQGRCFVNSCESTPYAITRVPNTNCFDITIKQCSDESKYKCCQGFHQGLHKIVLESATVCDKAVRQVTVNGIVKGGGLFFAIDQEKQEAEFRITSLRLNNVTAQNTRICITLDQNNNACNTLDKLCPQPCRVSTFDPFTHNCCATCGIINQHSDNPLRFPTPTAPLSKPPTPVIAKSPPPPTPLSKPPPAIAKSPPPLRVPTPPVIAKSPPPPQNNNDCISLKDIKIQIQAMNIQELYEWISK